MTKIETKYGQKVLVIDKTDLDETNAYVGDIDVTQEFDGGIEIAADLGWVRFSAAIRAKLYIVAKAGTGIKAGEGIEAGEGIKAGWGIEAGTGIKAGEGIKAGTGIKAGWGIEAGWGIKAGEGIKAGLSITAKWISTRLRIFAGLCIWKQPAPEETEIRAELRGGTVSFGTLVEPKEPNTETEAA